jgi:cytosine/adenosine deaminase-related metal-dependent hydrolase
MAAQSLKIDHILYLLTLDPQRRIIRDGAVLVEQGRIRRVGKAAELQDARADRVIDGRSMVVTPGFLNGHMHISYAHPVRGIFPDEQASPLVHVFNLQNAMTEERNHVRPGLVELVRNGTVCPRSGARSSPTRACRPADAASACSGKR